MATKMFMERRAFLKVAGAAFIGSLTLRNAEAFERTEALFASATLRADKTFGAAIFDLDGNIIREIQLPARGHDVAIHRPTGHCVVFARRPGTFAVSFDSAGTVEPTLFMAPEGRHFYGHGVFSGDGRLLYAAENDYDEAVGKIGIYDATNGFTRIGEFDSYGIGPHEIALLPDGKTLLVANGGIETHPDYQRQKLNLATMQPSIALIDLRSSHLIASFKLPARMHQVSLRHVAVAQDGTAYIGGQSQSNIHRDKPVLWKLRSDGHLSPLAVPSGLSANLAGYVGSVKLSHDQTRLAVTSPTSGKLLTIDLRSTPRISEQSIGTQGAIAWAKTAKSPSLKTPASLDNHCAEV